VGLGNGAGAGNFVVHGWRAAGFALRHEVTAWNGNGKLRFMLRMHMIAMA